MKIRTRITFVLITAVVAIVVLAAPALAHITVEPNEAPQGGVVELTFRVPNERNDVGTIKVEIRFPEEHPIADASVEPTAGWTHTVDQTDATTTVTWEGGPILNDGSELFTVVVGPLPHDTNRLVFKALQTYEDGEVVRWIDDPDADTGDDKPAPVLTLVDSGEDHNDNQTTAGSTDPGDSGAEDQPVTTEPLQDEPATSEPDQGESDQDESDQDESDQDESDQDESDQDGTTDEVPNDSMTVTAAPSSESSGSGLIAAGIGIGLIALVAGGAALVRTRRS